MKLLHVIPDLDPLSGGTVAALEGLAVAQVQLGWRVTVATTVTDATDRQVAARLRESGVEVCEIRVAGRLASTRSLSLNLRPLIVAADMVHVHAVWEEIQHQACRLARKCDVRYLVSPHGMLDPWSLGQGRWKKNIYLRLRLRKHLDHATAIHCTTETERELLGPLRLASPALVIPNGIDLQEFGDVSPESQGAAFLAKYPAIGGRRVVLFLSRLHPKKGLDILLPAFARCAVDDLVLVLAGPGDAGYVSTLVGDAKQLGIGERVLFTGMLHRQERIAALRAADLFVLPSYQENFGIAVIESLAAGTPVLISDQVNLAGAIRAGNVGQVIELNMKERSESIEKWSDGLECWIDGLSKQPSNDPDFFARANDQRRLREFANQYSFHAVAGSWQKALNTVLLKGVQGNAMVES